MVACGWVQHDHRLMWRQSDVLSGGPIHPRVLALGQSRLLTAMCWDCVRVAGGQPWLSWRAGSASIAGIGTGLGDTLYCRPKFCAVFLCSAFCKRKHACLPRHGSWVRNPADRSLGVHHRGRHGGWFSFRLGGTCQLNPVPAEGREGDLTYPEELWRRLRRRIRRRAVALRWTDGTMCVAAPPRDTC